MKPLLIMDQHFRQLEELFSPECYARLTELCDVAGGVNWPMAQSEIDDRLAEATFLVAAHPRLSAEQLDRAGNLKAIIEVAGTFRTGLDYKACFERGIEVLSCAPGFRHSVAEMTLGMMIAGGRGLVQEHEAFREGHERWLDDNLGRDFSLYGQEIGFVGYGMIARECARLLEPFASRIRAFDPWLERAGERPEGVALCDLDELVTQSRCIVVAAAPTDENYKLISADLVARMRPGTLVVVISRSHLVDYDALVAAASERRIRLAIDVFPQEPLPRDDAIRSVPNVILSPHRAAAVQGGRHPIGEMIVHDVEGIVAGREGRMLQAADPASIDRILEAPLAEQRAARRADVAKG
ncbi:NAD(P)-dependent oxidoreductase [Limimaricola pyoseonensis]|uniref:Phosphoglycerate dehydrogenase n=1 Tax=Limimaricola pyoseonensis TaxID=521013 RepID=A0A1G7CF36_9RHOB|nr:NAD(P)-dependent oxidoreductase [Limimaricola pyoseonensis]SDE37035.1 Phosphoglycerate dehydrogenase [Limimaricola pyoseonensis]